MYSSDIGKPVAGEGAVEVVAGILEREGRYLVALRSDDGELPGRWEFPGGKVETGESAEAALAREFREELDLTIAVGERIGVSVHRSARACIRLSGFRVYRRAGEPAARVHKELRWVGLDELRRLLFAPADVPLIELLEATHA